MATPLSSAGMGPTDLARLRRQRITSSMAGMPHRSELAPTAISTVSMVPLPASGTVSPALMVGGAIVTMVRVRDVMVGVDVTVSPKKELATDAFEKMEEAILSSMAAVAFAVAVVMMMSTRVDAALAITWTLLGPTPTSAATQTAMLFSRAVVKASIGSAATKPITTWSVIVVIDPGTAGDGGGGGGGGEGGDGSSGHSVRIEL